MGPIIELEWRMEGIRIDKKRKKKKGKRNRCLAEDTHGLLFFKDGEWVVKGVLVFWLSSLACW
jgi:hypothetical protein